MFSAMDVWINQYIVATCHFALTDVQLLVLVSKIVLNFIWIGMDENLNRQVTSVILLDQLQQVGGSVAVWEDHFKSPPLVKIY